MSDRKTITIVAFGDSITQAAAQECENRWPEVLRRGLQERFARLDIRVINAGAGGETSREGLARIGTDVLAHKPQYVLFEFGNDATPEPDRHVSLEEFTENVNRIINRVVDEAGGIAIPMTFPPVIDAWHSHYEHPFYEEYGGQDACQEGYRAAVRTIAHQRGVPMIDIDRALRARMSADGPESCILPDGVHLTAEGNACVAQAVAKVLKAVIEEARTEKGSRPRSG